MKGQLNIDPDKKTDKTGNSDIQETSFDASTIDQDDDMIYPDNHLDDDDRYYLFPGQNTD